MSQYRGSAVTFALVKAQISERFGEVEAEAYSPKTNCLTLRQWNAQGYKVKKGERALKSFTFVEDEGESKDKKRWRKSVFLFCRAQVEKVEEKIENKP